MSPVSLEQFLKQNGWDVVFVDRPELILPGDVVLVADTDQDDKFCCATVLRRQEAK